MNQRCYADFILPDLTFTAMLQNVGDEQAVIEEMSPDAFERLTQRLLRESGFIHVEVTGRTGDGGIDGKGIARINGLMSFHIAF